MLNNNPTHNATFNCCSKVFFTSFQPNKQYSYNLYTLAICGYILVYYPTSHKVQYLNDHHRDIYVCKWLPIEVDCMRYGENIYICWKYNTEKKLNSKQSIGSVRRLLFGVLYTIKINMHAFTMHLVVIAINLDILDVQLMVKIRHT